ncbi:hypothetical protein EHS13_18580 [Paenibacillus psychroresistens]|uniref:DUF2564 family protein n=1 Tax=Paenibacillus psychroresistens TaxID=1778678 RepID=A0A6B8RM59_9BACL|nr:hypothetical protein [Paenibacillus psychroresistens]QGQ96742.1 hypothetical protein EHS13_18580 [Paenibacillus psychroresistens]
MTHSRQHQELVKKAEEHAEATITSALNAGEMLDDALDRADPKLILSSQGRLNQVQHEVIKSQEQLTEVNREHKHDAQLQQVTENLDLAQEDVEQAIDAAQMPQQVIER